jgi:hypothetical protein
MIHVVEGKRMTGRDPMETKTDSDAMFEGWPGPLHDMLPGLPPLPRLGWEEQYAYTLGVQAYIYGFPWIYLSQLRWLWTTEAGINSYDPKYSSRQDDGSLTIRLQRHDIEEPEKGVYWLQTPPPWVGTFYLILRVYVPGPEISYTQTWMPPAIKRVG